MALSRSIVHGGTVQWTGTGNPPFPCTEDVILAVLRHVGGAKRPPLDPIIARQLTPWGGVAYVEWLFGQLVPLLPVEERTILSRLLAQQDQAAIGFHFHHNRNWVRKRIRHHLVPRLVALITMVAPLPQYSIQAMVKQRAADLGQFAKGEEDAPILDR